MQLLVFRAFWGMPPMPTPQMLEKCADAGYDGVEGAPPTDIDQRAFLDLLDQHDLKLILGVQISKKEEIEDKLKALADYGPMKLGLHAGRDAMTRDEGAAFLEEALRVEQLIGVPVAHETHRGRLFYAPWATRHYLETFPELNVLADYSHWVNVCERLPDDQHDALTLANQRAIHIHGRVGYEQGPQVPDPSALEYADHLAWHEQQWSAIKAYHQERGADVLTFCPEYGPPRYLHTLPHTDAPVADLWKVCLWGMQRARETLR